MSVRAFIDEYIMALGSGFLSPSDRQCRKHRPEAMGQFVPARYHAVSVFT